MYDVHGREWTRGRNEKTDAEEGRTLICEMQDPGSIHMVREVGID